MRINYLFIIFVFDSVDCLLGLMSIYMVMELIEVYKYDLKGKEMI